MKVNITLLTTMTPAPWKSLRENEPASLAPDEPEEAVLIKVRFHREEGPIAERQGL
jgi:hypothetical protein